MATLNRRSPRRTLSNKEDDADGADDADVDSTTNDVLVIKNGSSNDDELDTRTALNEFGKEDIEMNVTDTLTSGHQQIPSHISKLLSSSSSTMIIAKGNNRSSSNNNVSSRRSSFSSTSSSRSGIISSKGNGNGSGSSGRDCLIHLLLLLTLICICTTYYINPTRNLYDYDDDKNHEQQQYQYKKSFDLLTKTTIMTTTPMPMPTTKKKTVPMTMTNNNSDRKNTSNTSATTGKENNTTIPSGRVSASAATLTTDESITANADMNKNLSDTMNTKLQQLTEVNNKKTISVDDGSKNNNNNSNNNNDGVDESIENQVYKNDAGATASTNAATPADNDHHIKNGSDDVSTMESRRSTSTTTSSQLQEVDINPKFVSAPTQRIPLPKKKSILSSSSPSSLSSPSFSSTNIIFEDPILFQNSIRDFEVSQMNYQWESLITVPEQPIPNARQILNNVIAGKDKNNKNIDDDDKAMNDPSHPLHNCPPTTQFKIYIPKIVNRPNGEEQQEQSAPYWLLQSLDENGHPKSVGGDEYYITYTDYRNQLDPLDGDGFIERPTAVGFVEDFSNGWYKVTFIASFMNLPLTKVDQLSGYGYVAIHYTYTCGMGNLPPPTKDEWFFGGSTASKYIVKNVIQPSTIYHPWKDYYHDRNNNEMKRTMTTTTRATTAVVNDNVNDDELQTETTTTKLSFNSTLNFNISFYDVIAPVGDSVMNQWAEKSKKMLRLGKFQMPLNTTNIQYYIDVIDTKYGIELNRSLSSSSSSSSSPLNGKEQRVALVLGSSTWDACYPKNYQTIEWDDHKRSIRVLIRTMKEKYPKVDIYWKSPTALQIHIPLFSVKNKQITFTVEDYIFHDNEYPDAFKSSLRYLSDVRARTLYIHQMELMKELQIPVIDMYLLTYVSADYLRSGDARHYTPWFNSALNKIYGDGY